MRRPAASAQLKSAVLARRASAPGETVVAEAEATRDHNRADAAPLRRRRAGRARGAHGRRVTLKGQPELVPAPVMVPADPLSAAFPMVAALIVPGSDISLEGVMTNVTRTGLFTTLREMGADIEELDRRLEGGEDVADLRVRHSALKGVEVPPERAPFMIDEYLVLGVAARSPRARRACAA
jgi:3-phosphoshikimate 1-carboxyvinyltransferase